MPKPVIVAPSILSADFANLQQEVERLNASEADWIHCDIMDGRFVPNISFGLPVLRAIKQHATKPLDVHLMIEQPEQYVDAFKKAGADLLTVHYEACPHLHRTIYQIREAGMRVGVAINPHTSVKLLTNVLRDIDLVCLMSVNPGFGGQSFIERTYAKVRRLRMMQHEQETQVHIEIDGGVTLDNAPRLVAQGADVLVAGNTVFSSADPKATIAKLKKVGLAPKQA